MAGRVLARIFRPIARLVASIRPDRPLRVGPGPYKAVLHLLDLNSLARTELGEIPRDLQRLVKRKGIFFKYVNGNRVAEELDGSLSPAAAEANLQNAIKFYGRTVEDEINPTVLYEDSEEALIISTLRELDVAFFYVMRRISRAVSRNIVKIIAAMTALVIVFPFVLSFVMEEAGPPDQGVSALLYLAVCVVFFATLILTRMFYGMSARYNGQYFQYFVQTYFSRLLNQYKSAQTAFPNVLNDRTSSLDDIQNRSNLWFMNIHWLSARQWFLDLYVRNMRFQIGRNGLWAVAMLPAALFLSVWLVYWFFSHAATEVAEFLSKSAGKNVSITGFYIYRSWWTVVPSVCLLLTYGIGLMNLLGNFWDAITPSGWPSFRTMNVTKIIEDNVGPIAREIVDRRRNPQGRSAPQI